MKTIPETARPWLSQMILVNAVKDDVVGAPFSTLHQSDYIARCVPDFRTAIEQSITGGELQIPRAQIDALAQLAAAEMYEVRRLANLLHEGKLTDQAIRQTPLFKWYRDYFEESPRVVDLAIQIALHFGKAGGPPDPRRN